MYNPIIPTYKQIPSAWKDRPFENPNARSVVSGYLDNFDPDYVVPMGECINYNLDIGHRKKIDGVSEILVPFKEMNPLTTESVFLRFYIIFSGGT